MKLRLLVVFFGLVLATAEARLGETVGQLKNRLGKIVDQPRKDTAIWLVETRGGTLSYTVTFDAKGRSIAETLKPVQSADFSRETAQGFINLQLEPYQGSKTTYAVRPGEKYGFAGKSFVCSPQQWVIVDEPNGILIVFTQGGSPSVMAVRPEFMR